MYQAIIGKITVKEHPNADRLALGEILGFQVVVSKDTVDGQIGVFFPSDGCLSNTYCIANELWPRFEDGVRVGGGFIDPKNNRVRAQNFRGEISEGLYMPLSSLKGLISDKVIESLTLGTTFTELDGQLICQKWVNPQTRSYMQGLGNKAKVNRKETAWLTMWQDTDQLKYKISDLKAGDKIILTEKCHGTSGRSGHSWEEKVSPIWSWAERFRSTPVLKNVLFFKHYDYKWMNGTRRVLVDSFKNANGGYYSNADFRYKHEETLSKVLPPGFQAYYEIVGYTGIDSTIMGTADNAKHSKEFVKAWGKSTTFKYGCANGESRMYIYALSVTLPDGFKQWLNWDEMKYLCNVWGLQTVPYIEEFIYDGDSDALLAKCDILSKGASTLDASHIREGVCLMVPSKLKLQVFKVKSRDFYILEDVVKSDESVIDMEEAESY
jgi:hypothetical protein